MKIDFHRSGGCLTTDAAAPAIPRDVTASSNYVFLFSSAEMTNWTLPTANVGSVSHAWSRMKLIEAYRSTWLLYHRYTDGSGCCRHWLAEQSIEPQCFSSSRSSLIWWRQLIWVLISWFLDPRYHIQIPNDLSPTFTACLWHTWHMWVTAWWKTCSHTFYFGILCGSV